MSISKSLASFDETKSLKDLAESIRLLIRQKRMFEFCYGIYCLIFFRPSRVQPLGHQDVKTILNDFSQFLSSKDHLTRKEMEDVFGDEYAIHQLPEDFHLARIEAIVVHRDYLVIGEYGFPGKRIAFLTRYFCLVNHFYSMDSKVRHIHAIFKKEKSEEIIITTGDSAKYLDLWNLKGDGISFKKRIKKYLAGHTAITSIKGNCYLGTDFSRRPNYIEILDGGRYHFPKKANKMYAIRFHQFNNRYVVALNRELICFGGRHAVSIFDTERREFVYCEYHSYLPPESANKATHRKVISLRSIEGGGV